MKSVYLKYAAIIIGFLGLIGVVFSFQDSRDFNRGNRVMMEVVERPRDCDAINYRNSFITLEFEGRLYRKKVGKAYCPYLEDSKIKVVLSPDGKNVFFLREKDTFLENGIAASLIVLFACIILIKQKTNGKVN